jgi:GNAT superfamily N-acetyltransferase
VTLVEVDRLTAAQERDLYQLYRGEWWTNDRTPEDVELSLANTDVIAGLCERETGRLVAFARVLHDGCRKAFLLDVIVAPAWRSRGIGQRMMNAVLAREELTGVRHVELYCRPELVPFYERWGFVSFPTDLIAMRLERVVDERHGPSVRDTR